MAAAESNAADPRFPTRPVRRQLQESQLQQLQKSQLRKAVAVVAQPLHTATEVRGNEWGNGGGSTAAHTTTNSRKMAANGTSMSIQSSKAPVMEGAHTQ